MTKTHVEPTDQRDQPVHPDVDANRPRTLADHEVNPRLVDAGPRPNDVALGTDDPGPIVDPATGRPLPPRTADPDPRFPSEVTRRRAELEADRHEAVAESLRHDAAAPKPERRSIASERPAPSPAPPRK